MSQPRLILHVGRHKSGTSSLQNALVRHADTLRSNGILYPTTGRRGPAHHIIAQAMLTKSPDRRLLADLRKTLMEEARNFDTVIISSESFQDTPSSFILNDFFSGFHIETIAYVREFTSYIVSSYAQFIHANDFVTDFSFYLRNFNVDLVRFFNFWEHVSRRCEFVLFERQELHNGDIVSDFFHRAKLPEMKIPSLNANPSISGNLLYFKLLLNMSKKTGLKYYNTLSELAAQESRFRGIFQITPEQQRYIRNRPYNNILFNKVGKPTRQQDFTTGLPLPDWDRWATDFRQIASFGDLEECANAVRALCGTPQH